MPSPGAGTSWPPQTPSPAALRGGQAGQKPTSSPQPCILRPLDPLPGAGALDPQDVQRWLVLRDPPPRPPSPYLNASLTSSTTHPVLRCFPLVPSFGVFQFFPDTILEILCKLFSASTNQ